jgi:hypothetical protein
VVTKKVDKKSSKNRASGKLRIGDDWNAINIIALSQTIPLKAVAEFIENSIVANARNITIIRGREHGESYLRIIDDGDGIPRDEEGKPNFKHRHLNQTEAAELLGIDQPKVSRLLRGQLKEFSMTRLLVFMLRLDRDIEIRIKKHRSSRVPPSIEVLAS